MKKLIQGILDFRKNIRPGYRETFARLALGQSPDALFIGCSDSRVAVNVFASTDPGDLFVVRNVGNIVPPCDESGKSTADESEAAAIEFALGTLNVSHIIICGHSECGAMQALVRGRSNVADQHLQAWLRHAETSVDTLIDQLTFSKPLPRHNELSQFNVLRQLEHIKTYPQVRERIHAGTLTLHGWWFELAQAEVFTFDPAKGQFVLIDENYLDKVLS